MNVPHGQVDQMYAAGMGGQWGYGRYAGDMYLPHGRMNANGPPPQGHDLVDGFDGMTQGMF